MVCSPKVTSAERLRKNQQSEKTLAMSDPFTSEANLLKSASGNETLVSLV